MTVPANITTELASLQAQIASAAPLANASRATVIAIQLNAAQLTSDLEAAETATAGLLDSWSTPADPTLIASGILGLLESSQDQSSVVNMRGYVGRATTNLDQLP